MAKNQPHLWCYSQNKIKPKYFFPLQAQSLAEFFESLDSSLAQSAEEL